MDGTTTDIVACPSCGKRNRLPVSASGTPACATCHDALPWVVNAGDRDYDRAVTSRVPVLVDLWAPWCGPCRLVAPVLESLARQRAGRLKIVKINVDEAPAVAQRLGVQGVPTMLLVVGGRVVAQQVGALAEAALARWLDQHLASVA